MVGGQPGSHQGSARPQHQAPGQEPRPQKEAGPCCPVPSHTLPERQGREKLQLRHPASSRWGRLAGPHDAPAHAKQNELQCGFLGIYVHATHEATSGRLRDNHSACAVFGGTAGQAQGVKEGPGPPPPVHVSVQVKLGHLRLCAKTQWPLADRHRLHTLQATWGHSCGQGLGSAQPRARRSLRSECQWRFMAHEREDFQCLKPANRLQLLILQHCPASRPQRQSAAGCGSLSRSRRRAGNWCT